MVDDGYFRVSLKTPHFATNLNSQQNPGKLKTKKSKTKGIEGIEGMVPAQPLGQMVFQWVFKIGHMGSVDSGSHMLSKIFGLY